MLASNTTTSSPTVTRMAHVFAERRAATGSCTIEDLKGEGFTQAEIDANHAQAAKLANAKMLRRVDAVEPPYDREARVALGARVVTGMLPDPGQMNTALHGAGFKTKEIGDLWPEIIARAADTFDARTGRAYAAAGV